MEGREKNKWFWVTHPHEGDVWYPVFVNNQGDYIMAGNNEDKAMLDRLTWEIATMPS